MIRFWNHNPDHRCDLRQHVSNASAGPVPGNGYPAWVRFWPDWFDIPPYAEMRDVEGRLVYPRAPGIHTVQIRTGRRKFAQMGRVRDFSSANGGYTSPVFQIRIAEETDV